MRNIKFTNIKTGTMSILNSCKLVFTLIGLFAILFVDRVTAQSTRPNFTTSVSNPICNGASNGSIGLKATDGLDIETSLTLKPPFYFDETIVNVTEINYVSSLRIGSLGFFGVSNRGERVLFEIYLYNADESSWVKVYNTTTTSYIDFANLSITFPAISKVTAIKLTSDPGQYYSYQIYEDVQITLTGKDYEFSIDGGRTFQTSGLFSGLAAGTYPVQVKSGTKLSSIQNVTLTDPPLATVDAGTDATILSGETVQLNAVGTNTGAISTRSYNVNIWDADNNFNYGNNICDDIYESNINWTSDPFTINNVTNISSIEFNIYWTGGSADWSFFLNGVYIGSRAATGKTPFQCSQEGSNTYPSTIIISDERLFQNWFIDGANTLKVYDNVQNAAFAGITAKINYTTNAVTYDWSPADGLSAANIANPIASPTSTTTYTVNYKDAAGCAATDDITVTVGANSIATGAVDNTLCINENISVPYTATGTYNTTNTFTAQLSNATGDFTNAINIGSVAATTSGTITATLPANTTSGAGYRIRVVSGDAAVTGSDNGRDITITALATFYSDSDGDGYGNNSSSTQSCSAPAGYVSNNTDCDDNNAAFHPGATEVCNGIDDDCDGQIDEGVKTTYYRDADGDGYGNNSSSTQSCSAPAGYVSDNTDCDDSKATVHPGATEVCNGIDDDCDGQTDEGFDADGDGYTSCNGDCDDNNANVHPGAAEVCNGIDDNCDGQIDEGVKTTFYADADGDGYGNNSRSTQACSAPAGYVSDNTDCDDSKASVHPNATEVCNGIDDDCDGQIDEGIATVTYYRDADGDGYGNAAISTTSCSPPTGYVTNSTDCNDTRSSVHPGATEVCNGIDDDCDGQIDEGVKTTFYADADGDGYGNNSNSTQACSAPAGYVSDNTDCDDSKASVHPNATEVCNGIDDDCDGQIDEGIPTATYYRDSDGDSYGNAANTLTSCSPPTGYVTNGTDCDDTKSSVHPGAVEVCGNGIDDNCNGTIDEGCASVTMVISDAAVKEGNTGKTTMKFNVVLSKTSSQTTTVRYATQNGTATAGSDYVAKSGTLAFAAGTTKQSISITVNGDKTPEANETFTVQLSNAVNAQINDAVGLGTITNDDGTATITSARPANTDNQQGNPSVKVSPNPATSIVNIQLSGYSRNVTLQLLNASGVVLKQEKVQTPRNALQINVTDVVSGVYYVAVIDDKGNRQTEKVIVAR